MEDDLYLLDPDADFLVLFDILGLEFLDEEVEVERAFIVTAGGHRRSVYYVPFHPREDDIEEQLERMAHEAMLQQLTEARGVQRAKREYDKRIEDARALSMLSLQRQNRIDGDPLHRQLPVAAASMQKHLKQERERPSILPKNMQDDLLKMRRDAALQEANRVRAENKQREEEIRQTRLKNLERARKAKKKS